MIEYKGIKIKSDDQHFFTEGLDPFIKKDIRVMIDKEDNEDYIEIIKYIIDYVRNEDQIISEDQTVAYYSWLLTFKTLQNQYFDIYNINQSGEDFLEGCDLAISIVKSQSQLCHHFGLIPLFPSFNQQIVISKGVYEGRDIEGIRYDSPQHMTGWWLITDDYDDDIKSLMTVHYYHVAFKRPEILMFLGLPFGYRFVIDNGEFEVYKDEDEESQ